MAIGLVDNIRRCLKRGEVATWLVVINVVVFLAVALVGLVFKLGHLGVSPLEGWLSLSSYPGALAYKPWTLLTYMFTQFNILHLLFNMLWLWWFSSVLLNTLTDRHLLAIYISGGLAGALVYLLPGIFGASGGSVLIGSSASVMAVMTVAAFRSPDVEFNLFLLGPVKLKWIAIVCIVLAFLGLGGGNVGGELAHIGGVALGVVAGLCYRRHIDIFRFVVSSAGRKSIAGFRRRKAFSNAIGNADRLDQLLDKIRISGYDSLSRSEKAELNVLSRKLKK